MDAKTMGKRGGKRAQKHRSKAERLVWSWMGGPKRKKDLEVSVLEYIAMGCALRRELAQRMKDAKLSPADGTVYIVGNDPNLSKLSGEYAALTADSELEMGLAELAIARQFVEHQYKILGLVVCIYDREKSQWLVFDRPFIAGDSMGTRNLAFLVSKLRLEKQQQSAPPITAQHPKSGGTNAG